MQVKIDVVLSELEGTWMNCRQCHADLNHSFADIIYIHDEVLIATASSITNADVVGERNRIACRTQVPRSHCISQPLCKV